MRVVSIWFPAWPITRLARAALREARTDKSPILDSRAAPGVLSQTRPFALVARHGNALVLTAVNAPALGQGLNAGMALADARAAIPTLLTAPAEPDADRAALAMLARWVGRYGPNRNTEGDDGLWVDITGVAHLFGGETPLLDDLARRLAALGIAARVGLADTPGAAHALARFAVSHDGGWARAPEAAARAALSPLPVEALRLDAPRVLLLKRLGLRRIGQVLDLPRDSLARRFRSKDSAAAVLLRLDQALGLAAEPRRPLSVPPALSVERAFADPLISSEAIETVSRALCADLGQTLASKALGATALRLVLFRADGSAAEARVAFSRPVRHADHTFALLRDRLDHVDAGFGVDLLRLDCLRTSPLGDEQTVLAQPSCAAAMSTAADPHAAHLSGLVDRLSNRLGPHAVMMPVIADSHIPERANQSVSAIDVLAAQPHRFSRSSPRALSASGGGNAKPAYVPPWPYNGARPAFLLSRPERIRVVAEVPDGPPLRFTWRRVDRRVVASQGPERIAPEWWRALSSVADTAQRPARPRDYYRIEDQHGTRYWVFRHGLYNAPEGTDDCDLPPEWFVHGLFA